MTLEELRALYPNTKDDLLNAALEAYKAESDPNFKVADTVYAREKSLSAALGDDRAADSLADSSTTSSNFRKVSMRGGDWRNAVAERYKDTEVRSVDEILADINKPRQAAAEPAKGPSRLAELGKSIDSKISEALPTSNIPDLKLAPDAERLARIAARRADEGVDSLGTVGRFGYSMAADFGNTIGSGIKYLGLKTGVQALVDFGDKAAEVAEARRPKGQSFGEKVAGGVASVGASILAAAPATAAAGATPIAAGITAVAAWAPKLAYGLGLLQKSAPAVFSGAFEAAGNATEAYDRVLEKTGDKDLAMQQADKTFASNLPLNAALNKVGIFGDSGTYLKKVLFSGVAEGAQEGTQQIIGNYFSGDPAGRGFSESAALGAVVGHGIKAVTAPFEAPDISKARTVDEAIGAAQQNLAIGSTELAGLNTQINDLTASARDMMRVPAAVAPFDPMQLVNDRQFLSQLSNEDRTELVTASNLLRNPSIDQSVKAGANQRVQEIIGTNAALWQDRVAPQQTSVQSTVAALKNASGDQLRELLRNTISNDLVAAIVVQPDLMSHIQPHMSERAFDMLQSDVAAATGAIQFQNTEVPSPLSLAPLDAPQQDGIPFESATVQPPVGMTLQSQSTPATEAAAAAANANLQQVQDEESKLSKARTHSETIASSIGLAPEEVTAVLPDQLRDASQTEGTKVTRQEAKTIKAIAKLFRRQVVFFKSAKGAADGVVRGGNSTIYVNADSSISAMSVFGHELMHQMKTEMPAAWQKVADLVGAKVDLEKAWNDYHMADAVDGVRGGELAKLDAALEGKEGADRQAALKAFFDADGRRDFIIEEMTSDLTGNRFREPDFWREVFQEIARTEGKSSVERFAMKIMETIQKLINAIGGKGFDADQFVSKEDLLEIKAAVKTAIKDYHLNQRGDVPLSAEDTAAKAEVDKVRADKEAARTKAQGQIEALRKMGAGENHPQITRLMKKVSDLDMDLDREMGSKLSRGRDNQTLPTRWPTSKTLNPSVNDPMITDIDTLKLDPKQYAKAVEAVLEEPGMHSAAVAEGSTDEKADHVINRMVSNLLWLYDQVPDAIRQRSKLWYDGARKIAEAWSKTYDITESQAAGALAVLSPQKDWFMNVTMAERVLDIIHTKMDHRFDAKMDAAAFGFLTKESVKEDPDAQKNLKAFEAVKNKTLKQVAAHHNLRELSVWIRAYDEAYHDPKHAIVTPEGGFVEDKTTMKGEATLRAWGDFTTPGKAASIYLDGSAENINKMLGGEHKVRNFYNNIFAPKDPRFTTIDTHAVAADMLRPLAGADKPVAENFGKTGGTNVTGLSGTYAIHYEAYRQAAEARGVLPREMQSITWEAVRGLFTEGYKGKKENVKHVDAIWTKVDSGELSIDEARAQIVEHAGGIQNPDWWSEGNAEYKAVLRDKTYVQQRGAFAGAKMTFEVAPDPRNKEQKAKWDALPESEKADISHKVAWKVVAKALASFGDENMKGELHMQMGGFGADSNPSLSVWFNKRAAGTKIADLIRIVGYALNQQSMMRTSPKPFKTSSGEKAQQFGAIVIEIPKDFTPEQTHSLYTELRSITGKRNKPLVSGHTTAEGAMIILNNEEWSGISDEALTQRIGDRLFGRHKVILDTLYAEFPEKGKNSYGLRPSKGQDSGYSPEPSVRARADQLRAEAGVLFEQLIGDKSGHEQPADGSVNAGSDRLSRPRVGQGGRVDLTGVHYSSEQRRHLSGVFFGSGAKSEEAARVFAATDTRIKSRLYAYVDEGQGVFPEQGVGGFAHIVNFDNLYDIKGDPLGIRAKTQDANERESLILDSGFDGYYAEGIFGRQGVAILMGKAATKGVTPTESSEVRPAKASSIADEVAARRNLPMGKMSGADWMRMVPEATGLDPEKMYYKDDVVAELRGGAKFSAPRFYSQLERGVEQMPAKVSGTSAANVKTWINSNKSKLGIKDDEIQWSGLNEWLDLQGKNKVSKDDVVAYLQQNGVKVEEVEKRGPIMSTEDREDDTKYGEYVLPGGEDYRELLLTLPVRKDSSSNYRSSHWTEKNILAHVRFNDRVDADGNNVLFIEELQSDWSADGSRKGFAFKYKPNEVESLPSDAPEATQPKHFWYFKVPGNVLQIQKSKYATEESARKYVLDEKRTVNSGVEPGPFVTSDAWMSLAMKRMLAYAVENGYDKVAWINGQQSYERFPEGHNGESTEKGMKTSYDVKMPSVTNKILGQLGGGKVEQITIPRGDLKYHPVGYKTDVTEYVNSGFTITPEMREKVSQGLPLFSRQRIIGNSQRQYTPDQLQMFKNTGREITEQTRIERTKDYLQNGFFKKMAVGIVDQFRGLRDLDDGGQSYLLARLSKGTAGAVDALLHHGKLSVKNGAYDADMSGGFVQRLGIPLHGEVDDFLWWMAANRAEKLTAQGRENLFTPADIAAGKSLAQGTTKFNYTIQTGPAAGRVTTDRTLIFADAQRVFNEFQKNTLDIAEQSGLIDGAARGQWESEFYVPFYRVADEDKSVSFNKGGMGIVRQKAFEKLKGGKAKLNSDLLSNTLMNWSHLIEASAKNRAAKAALTAAEKIGVAHKATYTDKQTVWYSENGKKVEYKVDDPFVMTAITSLEYAGMRNGIMDAMSTMKHWLTVGVTASPAFKVRNLIRDSIQAIGTSELNYNVAGNVAEGWKITDGSTAMKNTLRTMVGASRKERNFTQAYVSALASGGLIRFGTMLEGSESARTRELIKMGVKDSTILNSDSKLQWFYENKLAPAIEAYNELGNVSEEVNRAALYNQLIKQGVSHAEAALMARDLMDFSMQGSWAGIRFLTQVVPFLNARLQGLYKLGRAGKDNPAKMGIVVAAASMFGLALLAAYGDDDEWKRRQDWDRDNYWWFKFGGEAFRIPKPFELGAAATLVERTTELMFDDEMTGKRYRGIVKSLVANNLSMNPVPQAAKPILDLYANKDYMGRDIETMSMRSVDPTERYSSRTSMTARGISKALAPISDATMGILPKLSPVQIDHLATGYFGWLGAVAVGAGDMAARAVMDEPTKPAMDYWKFATQGIVQNGETAASSRYVTMVYEQARELEQAHNTYNRLKRDGKLEEAAEYKQDHKEELDRYRKVEAVKKQEAKLSERIRIIERSNISADEKRDLIEAIYLKKEKEAKKIAPGLSSSGG